MEEYQFNEQLLDNLLEHYNHHFAGAAAARQEGVEKVKERLAGLQHRSVCLVCLELVGPTQHTWHCKGGCYQTFHLVCIKEWARKNKSDVVARGESRMNADGRLAEAARDIREKAQWRCPLCTCGYAQIPSAYYCYCGKEHEPTFDGWKPAHSCGELCENGLPCGHTCVVRCHPGPCPPCPRMVKATCYCGSVVTSKRCGAHLFSCGGQCGKRLPCGHTCKATCHEGDCPSCEVPATVICRCGKATRKGPCGDNLFNCGEACGKLLSCGVHQCPVMCHQSPCDPCDKGRTTCPCGKVKYSDLRCDASAPSCGDTCGKILPCGGHHCMERCHEGACPSTCREMVTKSCRCGRSTRKAQCAVDLKCDIRCDRMRSCGRHVCKRRCCDGNCPPCEEVCKRRLNCGNHRCRDTCHAGSCQLCPLKNSVCCACGRMNYSLPCGAERRAVEARCYQACHVAWACRHRGREPSHRCHYGPCPPCESTCGTPLPCGHSCNTPCHDPPAGHIPPFQPPPPPQTFIHSKPSSSIDVPLAEQASKASDEMWGAYNGQAPTPCPPCNTPVPVTCFGGHVSVSQACHVAQPFSCDTPCGRPLPCGNHTCSLKCHPVTDEGASSSSATDGMPCERCERPCEVARACGHECPLDCHQPPCLPCVVKVGRVCYCGKTGLEFECNRLREAEARKAVHPLLQCGKPCHKPLSGCPHFCKLSCHQGGCASGRCSEDVTVRCRCKRIKKKMPCKEVKALLKRVVSCDSYDATTALKLLDCDALCQQKTKADEVEGAKKADNPAVQDAQDRDVAASAAAAEQTGLRHRRTREERLREKEAQAAEKEVKRRRAWVLSVVLKLTGLLVAGGLVALLAVHLTQLLDVIDEKAQERWKRQ